MKNIFITGCAGFIGYHLALSLHSQGYHVIGYDNFNSYYCPQLKCARALELENQGVEIIEGDICHMDFLQRAVEQHQTTHLIHLAAQPGVRYSLVNPRGYIKNNIDGFLNILECCRLSPNIKLTYASSSTVYGTNSKIPFSIDDRTDHQSNLYGVTKKSNELMAHNYHHLFGISVTGLRFFSVYGPWGRPDMAYYHFADAILAGRSIDIYNNGKMRRDFTYIDDIVSGITSAIEREANCELFNLGNHEPVELMKMVELLEKHLGKEAIKNLMPMQPGEIESSYANIEYSSEKLQFCPKTKFSEGIAHFVEWYRRYHQLC